MTRSFITIVFVLIFHALQAQDAHFTQFYAAPLYLNPALTGAMEGKYRLGAIYRDQWRKVLDQPLQTFSFAGDFRFNKGGTSNKKDAFGIGLMFFNDKTSVFDFNTTQISVSSAFHKALDADEMQFLSLGVQIGLTQRGLNYEGLDLHDEFDGVNGYLLPTGEAFPENNINYSDFNVGLNYSVKFSKNSNLFMGAAMHHVAQPRLSFYKADGDGNKLFRKYTLHVAGSFATSSRISVLPRILVMNQNNHLEINAGTNLRFKLGQYGASALHLGGWVRPVRNVDGIGLDAAVLLAGYEVNGMIFGLSYDLNLKGLTTYRKGQGAFEISLTYLGDYDSEEIVCPKF